MPESFLPFAVAIHLYTREEIGQRMAGHGSPGNVYEVVNPARLSRFPSPGACVL